MIKLKIIDGNRAESECKLIAAICLGSLEEAERLSSELRVLPRPDLRLVCDNKRKPPAGDGDAYASTDVSEWFSPANRLLKKS